VGARAGFVRFVTFVVKKIFDKMKKPTGHSQ